MIRVNNHIIRYFYIKYMICSYLFDPQKFAKGCVIESMKKMYVHMAPQSTLDELTAACEQAATAACDALCVPQWFVAPAAAALKEKGVAVATIVGLPGGTTTSSAKYAEAKLAVANGAGIVIVPMNLELCKTDAGAAKNDFVASAAPVKKHGKRLWTLIDAACLTAEQAVTAAGLGIAAGAELALLANADDALMDRLAKANIPAGTFGKATAAPSALCASAEL